jgi:hypothetical protein
MFGLLEYRNSSNLGDNIQSIAAKNLLPCEDVLVDRDTSEMTYLNNSHTHGIVNIIYNGWFDSTYTKWTPPPNLNPLFVSFHLNDTNHTIDKSYAFLEKTKLKHSISIASYTNYFKQYEPIGCRDPHTVKLFSQNGIKAEFTGCLTLTLENKFNYRTDEILIVDVNAENLLKIPLEIRNKAIYITHALKKQVSHQEKMKIAQSLLDRYATAKEVYTSRLHCLLPCKAFLTKVTFLPNDPNDVRFIGLANLNAEEVVQLAQNLRCKIQTWIESVSKPHGVSIFTACMNRIENLREALPTWVAVNPKEIIIVDWGSDEKEIVDLVSEYSQQHPKIILIRVSNVKKWILTYALNFASQFTSGKYLLKVDCDTKLDKRFFLYHNLNNNVFFAGNWRTARNINERHTNGIFFVARKHFVQVGGFNELLTHYGYDDCKLYSDFESIGLNRVDLYNEMIYHIPHTNAKRVEYQNTSLYTLDVQIECNRLICVAVPWIKIHSQFRWCNGNTYKHVCSMVLDETIQQECLNQAIINRSKYKPVIKKHLYICVKNGLGNRLRALSSAFCIAKASNRTLVVIWIPDLHCFATFSDLFKPIPDVIVLNEEPTLINCDVYDQTGYSEADIYDYAKDKDVYINDESLNDIYVSSACVLKNKHTNWNKESKFLQSLVVIPEIQTSIDTFSNDISSMIGVHIRMSQPNTEHDDISNYPTHVKVSAIKWRSASHWKVFFVEMNKIVLQTPNQKFFVCCDNETAHHEMSKLKNVVFYPEKLYDRSKHQIQLALIEVILLSKTKSLMGSNWSTFTELAKRFGNSHVRLAGVDF